MTGVPIYQAASGIQVLTKVTFDLKFVAVPLGEILTGYERNTNAVEIALNPLPTRGEQMGTKR